MGYVLEYEGTVAGKGCNPFVHLDKVAKMLSEKTSALDHNSPNQIDRLMSELSDCF
jgi:hypothetical protein